MGTWFKRIVLCLWLALFVVCLVLYFWSTALVEGLLAPSLEVRNGKLDIESIRLHAEGIEIGLERYEESALAVRGLTVTCPWSQLWSFRDGFGGRLHFEEIRVRLGAEPKAAGADEPLSPAEQVGALAAQIDGLPLQGVEVAVDELWVEHAGQSYRVALDVSLLRGEAGDTHLTAQVEGGGIDLEIRVKVLAGGEGLAMDFVGSVSDWDAVQARYLPVMAEALAVQQAELYVSPLGEGRGFLNLSGYARWASAQPDQLNFTLLADLGASELYFAEGECLLRGASLGLAGDGVGRVHAYAKGAVESVRYGSWMQSEGDWALRLDSGRLAAELRLGDALSLSLGHTDWRQALAGSGEGQIYVEADGVDGEWLRILPIRGVPDDLELDMDLRLEGRGTLDGFGLASATFDADADIRRAALPSKGLTLRDLKAQVDAGAFGGSFALGTLKMQLGEAEISGFALGDVDFAVKGREDGTYVTSPVQARFMGGGLRVDAATIDPGALSDLSLRASVDSIELTQLAQAVPQFKGEISGTVSGHLVAGWRQRQLILTDGQLEVDPEVGARLRYDVDGLLTRGMSPGSSAYKQYRMAEKAFSDLKLKRFRIEVFPEGNATRPFRMELFGESVQDGTVVPVDFDLNVNVDDTAGLLEILRLMRQGKLDLN